MLLKWSAAFKQHSQRWKHPPMKKQSHHSKLICHSHMSRNFNSESKTRQDVK